MARSDVLRAQRWFWGLTVTAVLALGALVQALGAPASPVTGSVTFLSGTVLLASSIQAARILARLAGPLGGRSGSSERTVSVFGRRK